MKGFLNFFKNFKNLALFLATLAIASYGAYWLVFMPKESLFGLVQLVDKTWPAPQKTATPSKKIVSKPRVKETMTAISQDDIMASEQDERGGEIRDLSKSVIDAILKDRENRVSDLFTPSNELRSRIEFWFKIYSIYTISHAVIHDADRPWLIYEVVHLNPVYDKFKKGSERRAEKARLIREAKKRAQAKGAKNIRLQLGQKDSVVYAIKKSGRYLKSMEKIFSDEKLPVELTRIPFLESSFNLNAYSKDGASGVWQFMSKTGNVFLTVSQAAGIDERRHPLKATYAATRLLKQNYKIFKEWPLAITAYNHGPGGLLQGIKKLGTKNLARLIEKYDHPYFGFASKNFYSEFLAVLHVEKYQDKIFGYLKPDPHLEHDDIEIQYSMRVKYITELCKVTLDEIKIYNPDLQQKALDSHSYLPEGYYLKLPKGKKSGLLKFYKEVEETNRLLDQMLGKEKD
jgi:membrane-bound lytic murein transglycosylase D